MRIQRTGIVIRPDITRVLFRPFMPADPQRRLKVIARLMMLGEEEVQARLEAVQSEFQGRHYKPVRFFLERFEQVKQHLITDQPLSEARKLLIGAYFSQEYSLVSAALFNPSMVWHPDQAELAPGSARFILSLRATGEGHVSSITFRSGVIDAKNRLTLDPASSIVTSPAVLPDAGYDKPLFQRKLAELGLLDGFCAQLFPLLEDHFTLQQLRDATAIVLRQNRARRTEFEKIADGVCALAKANYEIAFTPDQDISERVIFPYSPTESNGIEDARFVRFIEEDGSARYYATYSAYDGKMVLPQILETTDFLHFKINTLNGPEVRDKGFALFPRKVNGLYAMLSRQDGENMYLMYSDMIHFWYTKQLLMKPAYPWEYVQVGNCGSPIETDAGWLVLTHGVGPMRKYSIGAALLDRDDPSRVIGRLREPLLVPNENERKGYVPNVVYSCGALLHNGDLIVPYAMADYATTFATVPLEDLLAEMTRQ
jgi:predicted GH43/DUF377 family glycosyl hydrolase